MLRDFKIFRRQSGKNSHLEGNENLLPNATDLGCNSTDADSTRAPLNAIQDPAQNTRPSTVTATEQELAPRSKPDRTPSKTRAKGHDGQLPLRTPEKVGSGTSVPKNRFGWVQKNDPSSNYVETRDEAGHLLPTGNRLTGHGIGGFPSMTPRSMRSFGRASSAYSEGGSAQSTPTKSVGKPPNPGFGPSNGSRPPLSIGTRGGNFALLSKGIPTAVASPTVVNSVDVPHFELREDPSFWMDHNVQVLIRVRPLNSMERSLHGFNRCLKQESVQSITWIGQPEMRFTFDHVACETINQEMLFRVAGLPMVENCLSGYNSCVFAYGQTGSGKTYTMLGEIDELDVRLSPDRGMTPRIFEFLFARIRAEEESRRDEKLKYSCKCSFLEIYNEQITDLLDPSSTNLLLREDIKKGVYVENLTEFEVETVNDILKLLIQGAANRKVAATNMNRESSRSHSVFTCVIESQWEKDSTTNIRFARLNLVDLAGSERQKTSGAEGERLKEAANINKSLSTLGHVIMLLVDVAHGKQRHVPYRDSRLTFLLQDSLGGNSKTMIVANVSPSICCAGETLSTLKFAQRAKLIQNNAIVNEDTSGDVLALQHQIRLLKDELSLLKRQNVSRSLLFDPRTFDESGREEHDTASEGDIKDMDISNSNEYESSGFLKVSNKQLKSLEKMLAGSIRREQMADTAIKQLEAEIEQLNRLVHQREEDTRCTKMMLRFREEKIQRMKSHLDGLMPVDSYLAEENNALTEEMQLLRARVDRNPEVTRFALENIRLLDQLRKFQDFYEEGEREILLAEISELRNQLVQFLHRDSEPNNRSGSISNVGSQAKEAVDIGIAAVTNENDSLQIELKQTCKELEDCRNSLNACLEMNANLSRELDELRSLMSNNGSPCMGQHLMLESQKQKPEEWKHEIMMKHDEEMMNLQLELDILKSILEEERSSHGEIEARASHLSQQYGVIKIGLENAKSVIEALESQQCISINEMEELRDSNNQYEDLLKKQEQEISILKKQLAGHSEGEGRMCCSHQELRDHHSKHVDGDDSPLNIKLKRMQTSLEKARKLNIRYWSDQASQASNEEEKEEVRSQVEAEMADVIVCLQEELFALQQQVEDSNKQELLAKEDMMILESEMKKLQSRLCSLSEENKRLNHLCEEKDEEIGSLTEEWGKLACDIAEVLSGGNEALQEASIHVDSIADSCPPRIWISEQFGRMIRTISEKELLIEDLQKFLEDAQILKNDMDWKLRSLRGATLAITEAHQQESSEKEKEIHLLRSQLSVKELIIQELQEKVGLVESQIQRAQLSAIVAFVIVNRFSELHSIHVKELKHLEIQLNESVETNLQKAALLQDQITLTSKAEREIQQLQVQLKISEENTVQLKLQIAEQQGHLCAMEKTPEKIERDSSESKIADYVHKTKDKLNELKMGVQTINSCMDEYMKKDEWKIQTLGRHVTMEVDKEATQDLVNKESESHPDTANGTERSVHVSLHDYSPKIGKNVNDISQQEMKGFHCGQEEFKSGKILEDVHDRDVIILLKEEIECALESLWGVQAQMSKLLAEKEAIKNSEMQSQRRIECLTSQVCKMQMDMNTMEKHFEIQSLEFHHKLEDIEEMVEEANACYSVANKVLELELGEVKVFAGRKVSENSCVLSKFEEAQETIKEAEETINALVKANETAKVEVERLKKMEVLLTEERDFLTDEVESLQSLKDAKEQHCEKLEKQIHSNLVETNNLIDVVDEILVQDCKTVSEDFKSVVSDVRCLKSELLQSVNLAKILLEEIWSEIIAKDCAVSVLHLCHIGIFLETVTGLNAENSFLHHGLCESNSVIADLREHNFKAKRELEMCSVLKGKLLFDIKNSFHRIARQENETGNLSEKLQYFEKRILDLQIQEESMLARSNSMGIELAVLMKEFDLRSKEALIALSDNQKLLNENDELRHQLRESLKVQKKVQVDNEIFRESVCRELNDVCPENIKMMEVTENDMDFAANMLRLVAEHMYSKDIESFVLASELKQRASEITKMGARISDLEKQSNSFVAFFEVMMTELISANVDKELEVAFLREEFHETYIQLGTAESDKQVLLLRMKEKNDRILEMDKESKALEKDIQSLREAVDNDKSELLNKSIELDSFRESLKRLLEELQKKEKALQNLLHQMSALDLQNQKLQDDVSLLQSSISRLQTELDIKTVEANDIQHSSSLSISAIELKKEKEVATLRSKLDEMEKENEKMKHEMDNLKAECSMVFEELKGKQSELDSSSCRIHSLDQENHGLKETVSTLEACITDLHSDQDMRVLQFEEVHLSLSKVVEDNQKQRATTNMLKLENESLGKDLLLIKQRKDESLSSFELSVSCCYELVEKVVSSIEKKSNKIQEKMLEEFCEFRAMMVKFISEFEGLEASTEELISANSSLQLDLARKDEILKGLQFDLSLLQESAANAKDQKDEYEEVVARLESLEEELEAKINELDEAASREQILEAQLLEKAKRVTSVELDLEEVQKSLKLLSHDNLVMKAHIEDLLVTENSLNGELVEKTKMVERLEEEILELSASLQQMNHSFEGLRSNLSGVSKERDCLVSEALVLKEQLEMAQAVAEENEAIAAEAQEMAEARKSYAEEKEEEVKLLEKSVEELECTVNVLENKVEMIKSEAERQHLQREELEMELQSLKHQMMTVHKSASIETSQKQNLMKEVVDINLTRFNEGKLHDLQEAYNQIKILQNDIAKKEAEVAQCKAHISELNMHAEAQGREYKQKFRELEAMAQHVKPDTVSSNFSTNWTATKTEKHVVKPRGSGSPFKCIGLGLTQQINSEKEEELTAGRHRISELEALLATKQKEIFMLNARLAAAESMTHDVIRDLLGVKLDMAHYATLLDHQQVLKITEQAQLQTEESEEKAKEVVKLKQQLNVFIEERQGWLDEVNRKHAEMVAARVALEKLQQQDQFLTTENQMLKVDNSNHKQRVVELEDEVKKLSGQQNLQQRIHHHAKIKEENNVLKTQKEDLAGRLRRTEALLSRVKEELASYRASDGKNPYIDMDEEQQLKNKLATTEEERVQLAQKLFSLYTSILKAAGLTMPATEISPSVAEKAINQLKERVASLEQELQETKYKNKISGEKIRLSELRQPSSPFSARTDENCPTPQPRRTSRASSVSALR